MIEREYTPDNIESLPDNGIFVFGSNTEGRHGKGAALIAKQKFGAIYGQAEGLQGKSYAIITKDLTVKDNNSLKSVSLDKIAGGIVKMLNFAIENPDKIFYVTKLGSSLAGYTAKQIRLAFMIHSFIFPSNVILPREYEFRND